MILVDIQPSTTSIVISMLGRWDMQNKKLKNKKRPENHKSQAGGVAQSSVWLDNL